ncbi:tigger transposable element-derived protein 6-like [Mastacembelus armatus]|uniref:tigger transposable element-derived protein 6-like n=1 Tax=Mastacembelus armatus TaxID=205130 RepID=UPI001436AF50|nr:tigger transposable element-derived protein 6-like [Mastacembelus armatus]
MPRQWKRKTDRGVPANVLKVASDEVTGKGKSVRSVAKAHGICHVTLSRYCKSLQKLRDQGSSDLPSVGYRSNNKVFSEVQEKNLADYLTQAADLYYGLTPREVRKFAFQLAVTYNITHPQIWNENQMAGPDWFTFFMKRNPSLSMRSAEATSLTRATSFNRTNVERFFNSLGRVIERYKFDGSDIWNVDETGVTTVQTPERVVARRGVKQVGAMTSGERGVLVSVACAVQALGNAIPPFFVFPRKRYKEYFVQNGPTGSAGSGNASGWMQEEDFLLFLNHFAKHTKVSPEKKVLLLMDNHSSHLSVKAIDFCKEKGIVLLTFPPHCSHKLQPLDCSVYGPFKKMVNTASDAWMKMNPAKTMTIYDIPNIVKTALSAATPKNIRAGFQTTGIWPFNPDIFEECDYAPSQVTDRPDPGTSLKSGAFQPHSPPIHLGTASSPPTNQVTSGSSAIHDATMSCAPAEPATSGLSPGQVFSPSALRPFPKAGPRKTSSGTRRKRQSEILTDTPVKQALMEEEQRRGSKNVRKSILGKNKGRQKKKERTPQRKTTKKILKTNAEDSETSDDENLCVVCLEAFGNSKPKEVWVKCAQCSLWAHQACTPGLPAFICHHCDSD